MNHTVIYVTGLKDNDARLERVAVAAWRVYGVQPVFFQTRWSNGENFDVKKERLAEVINREVKKGNTVSLVAVSGGASLAIAVYVNMKSSIHAMVFICGKILRPEIVSERYFRFTPAFRGAMAEINANVAKLDTGDRAKILSLSPIFDETVAKKDTVVEGAKNKTLPTLFHIPTIAIAITLLPLVFLRFIKSKNRVQ